VDFLATFSGKSSGGVVRTRVKHVSIGPPPMAGATLVEGPVARCAGCRRWYILRNTRRGVGDDAGPLLPADVERDY